MAIEIEKKYLITDLPKGTVEKLTPNNILQGYIAVHEDKTEVRVRKYDDIYWQTIKSPGHLSRQEFEWQITEDQFQQLWPLTSGRNLEKNRFVIPHEDKLIELDVYAGNLEGLIVAEVEFNSMAECESFIAPPWFAKEISGERQFKNFILASEGLPQ